jgi:predicted transcriptional regulator
MSEKITLTNREPGLTTNSDELAQIVLERIGLQPRKTNATQAMHRTLIEFYERMKKATAQKDPKLAVMTVEDMAMYAKISRQTMYEYLGRWLEIGIIQKVTFIGEEGKVIIGYKLSGTSLEESFTKVRSRVEKNLNITQKLIQDLQKMLKNEKISASMKKSDSADEITSTED